MSDDTQARKEAEAFADYFETAMREFGVTGDYFSPQQRERWRQDAVTAHMGSSPEGDSSFTPAANDSAAKGKTATEIGPEIGDVTEDGTIYAGISPDTHKPLYTTPADAPLNYTFNQAQKYAAHLDAHGHQDWHVPTKGELNVLFRNRVAIGGFNETGSHPAGWYWSSSHGYIFHDDARAQRFSDGFQGDLLRRYHSSLRCVR